MTFDHFRIKKTTRPGSNPFLGLVLTFAGLAAAAASGPDTNRTATSVSGPAAAFEIKSISSGTNRAGGFDPDVVLPPAWAFGVLYGYYTNEAGILNNLQRLEAGDFPVDAIWEDSSFWDITTRGPKGYLDFKGDRNAFPDLRRLTDTLAHHHVRFGIWIWDRIYDVNRGVFNEFASRGYFKPGEIVSNGWHNASLQGVARSVDFANPAAAALWVEKLRPLLADGVDFFKIDSGPQTDYLRTHFELSQKFGRHTGGRGFVLSHAARDSLADIKRYPAAWTGDAQASWNQPDYPDTTRWILGGLRQQIEMVANPKWSQYRYPFLSNDTGGFHPRTLQGTAADELFIRWAQFSSFGSLMHVFGGPTVPYQNSPFGWPEAVQQNFRVSTHLRLRLFPYIYTHALLTRLTGSKIIQGEVGHPLQYHFGDAFLVAPVYEPGATNRTLWLPPGQRWIDYWTGQSYAGGQEVTVPAPLEHLPLLVRAGAIIPLRDYAPSVLRGTNATLTLDVYPEGASAESEFTLYEDDGTSNAYLTNGFAATRITCQPGPKMVTLHIAAIQGRYIGELKSRCWKLQMHRATKPVAVRINGKPAAWQYDVQKGIVQAQWITATSRPSDVVVTF
jgi:alpha-glucosidase (family GH31 glycosyl hydrolase)